MDKQTRRQAVRNYKEREVARGVYAVRCAATGEVWVGASRNLGQQQNAIWFGLRTDGGRNRAAQLAWRAHGEASFSFETLEEIDPQLGPVGQADALKGRLVHWQTQLGAPKLVG
jgi:hypothetical protein